MLKVFNIDFVVGEKIVSTEYSDLFKAALPHQLLQMEENDHKTGWDDIDIPYANYCIIQNLIKFDGILKQKEEVIKIAANIANFAHMIILKCEKEKKENEYGNRF